jgi:hypothetical protein
MRSPLINTPFQRGVRALTETLEPLQRFLLTENNNKQQNERKSMNDKFDELAKGLAQATTRRLALKKFGVGLAGMALACFGLTSRTNAGAVEHRCRKVCAPCGPGLSCCKGLYCDGVFCVPPGGVFCGV